MSSENSTPLAGLFDTRAALQQMSESPRDQERETYSFILGVYDSTVVNYARECIERTLELSSSSTHVAADLGGGAGESMDELAKEYEPEVLAGRLAFVVTCLADTPESMLSRHMLDDETRQRLLDISNSGLRGAKESVERYLEKDATIQAALADMPSRRTRMHFIDSTLEDLSSRTITVRPGAEITLQNSAFLIHESNSVTAWGRTPETTLPHIASFASSTCNYLVTRYDTEVPAGSVSGYLKSTIVDGIRIAHEELVQKHSFRKLLYPSLDRLGESNTHYYVFSRP